MGESSQGVDFELLSLYYLDSKDRQIINPTTGEKEPLYDFTVTNNCQLNKISYWGLIESNVQLSYPNINGFNNKLVLVDNTGTYNLTFKIDRYLTTASLLTYLQSVFTPLGYTLTIEYSTALRITNNGGFNFSLTSVSLEPSLMYMLGFSAYQISGANSYLGDLNFSVYYTRYFDICSNTLMKFSLPSQGSKSTTRGNLIKRIDLVGSSGDLNSLQGTYIDTVSRILPKYKWDNSTQLGQIDIQLYDEWGFPFYTYSDFTLRLALFKNIHSNDELGRL